MPSLSFADRVDLVIGHYVPRDKLFHISTCPYLDSTRYLVSGDGLSAAMESLARALELDDTAVFDECVEDTMKERGISKEAAHERVCGDDNGWIWVNGRFPVSTSDWSTKEAGVAEQTFVTALQKGWCGTHEGDTEDVTTLNLTKMGLMLKWFFDEPVGDASVIAKDLAWLIADKEWTQREIAVAVRTVKEMCSG